MTDFEQPAAYPQAAGFPQQPAPALTTGPAQPDDLVLATLGGLGEPVDCTSVRSLPLEGPHVLWLVAGGALDLFAVDAAQQGRWHFLGRLETGTLLLGRQPSADGFPAVFVLPSPSGAASGHWTLQPWRELAEWIRPNQRG